MTAGTAWSADKKQIVRLKDAGADVVLHFSTPKFTAQGLRKIREMGCAPLQFLVSPSNSIKGVIEPAGFENAQGVITTQFSRQARDPAWENDPEVIEYIAFTKKWAHRTIIPAISLLCRVT